MQLRRLAALERLKIEEELKLVREMIAYLEDLLAHPEKILKVVREEQQKIRDKYTDDHASKTYRHRNVSGSQQLSDHQGRHAHCKTCHR
jgi:DNA gyrase/topoisomerase IV subunit A